MFVRNGIIPVFLVLIAALLSSTPALSQEAWERGGIIGLHAGTCIREGPGYNYRAHTRVPENDWAVMIVDGPRTADGHIWWDTSRHAAGDPSGGTGWVTEDQTDTNCEPDANISPTDSDPTPESLIPLTSLWYGQPALVKWSIAVLTLLIAPVLWRSVGGLVIGFIGAALLALAVWILLDLTRSLWEGIWLEFATPIFGADIPDFALLLAVVPLASWSISLTRQLIRGGS